MSGKIPSEAFYHKLRADMSISYNAIDDNNKRYNQLSKEQLSTLCLMRLENERFDMAGVIGFRIDDIKIGVNSGDCFTVKYEIEHKSFGISSHGFIFHKFFINEFDYLHECLKENHCLPVSKFIFVQNDVITSLECSVRGYRHAIKEIREFANSKCI